MRESYKVKFSVAFSKVTALVSHGLLQVLVNPYPVVEVAMEITHVYFAAVVLQPRPPHGILRSAYDSGLAKEQHRVAEIGLENHTLVFQQANIFPTITQIQKNLLGMLPYLGSRTFHRRRILEEINGSC